jgi:molybdate transport system substrate-binding protein
MALAACAAAAPAHGDPVPLRVAAAADLGPAFKELAALYQKQTGQPVSLTFGSTGLLAKQILQGAPFDVFAAANTSYIDDLVVVGACRGDSRTLYARGRLVVWGRKDGQAPEPSRLSDLADEHYRKIALANPEHAPYGKAAKEALESAGLWEAVRARLVYGENVQQAFQFAQTGNADVALVALSLAIAHPEGAVLAVDDRLHRPLEQALAVCDRKARSKAAWSFIGKINDEEGRAIMRRYGFLLPGESLPQASASILAPKAAAP